MLEGSLTVHVRELLRIGNGLQDLRQVMRCLKSINGRRLERAGCGVVKAKSLKNRHDVIAQPGPQVTGVRDAQNHPPHHQPSKKLEGIVSREAHAGKIVRSTQVSPPRTQRFRTTVLRA
jgi:hypothetical protein